ncbi:MAG: ATP-grasp domain-containing protein [Clostridiaceae bacterium]|nr:ATP-grasp domain-containing protein [Clostridiaceae bacterium]
MIEKVAIIGAGIFQKPLIEKAKSMGYETHVFAWEDGAVGREAADYFYPVSIVEKEQILALCRSIRPAAVASIASDLAAITVNEVACRLGLPSNSPECVKKTTNKYLMRRALQKAGIPVPDFVLADQANLAGGAAAWGLSYPLIVKPTDRSGSRGIALVHDDPALRRAVETAAGYSFQKKAIVETVLEGPEYSCECLTEQGQHHLLALTQKITTGAPDFIETGHRQPAAFPEAQKSEIAQILFAAYDALDITCGASHAEFRVDHAGRIRIIEIGARMGGDCIGSHLVPLSTGYDFMGMVLDVAAGKRPNLQKQTGPRAAAINFIMNGADLAKMNRIVQAVPESVVEIGPIELNDRPVVDSSSRYGYYILAAGDTREMERILAL